GDDAERDGVVRVEVEVVVGLEIGAAEAEQRAHPPAADLSLRGEAEKAARRRLAGEQRLSPRQAEPMLESGARLLELVRAPVMREPEDRRLARAAQVQVHGVGLLLGAMVRVGELPVDRLGAGRGCSASEYAEDDVPN